MSLEKKYSLLLKFTLSKKTLEKTAKERKESKKDRRLSLLARYRSSDRHDRNFLPDC